MHSYLFSKCMFYILL